MTAGNEPCYPVRYPRSVDVCLGRPAGRLSGLWRWIQSGSGSGCTLMGVITVYLRCRHRKKWASYRRTIQLRGLPRRESAVDLMTAILIESSCAACPHDWEAHDHIGIRYCAATTARGLRRKCVCARPVDDEPTYYR